jgi:hypothetical protein
MERHPVGHELQTGRFQLTHCLSLNSQIPSFAL